MNLANKLTLLRVILVPFFAFFMLAGDIVPYSYLWAAVIFAVAICFVELGWASAWVTAIIVAREFVVSGIRLIAAGSEKKTVIAASIWGKLKTASTMVAICVIIILHILVDFGTVTAETFPVQIISDILMYISCILTTVSGIKYLWDYREVLKTDA